MLKLSLFSHKEYFQKCFDFSRNYGFLYGIEIYDIINIYQIHTNKNVYHRKEKGFLIRVREFQKQNSSLWFIFRLHVLKVYIRR